MIFASSNHVVGFHERTEVLDSDCHLLADGYYGLSKIYGEQTGRLYWDKHGVTSVFLRIGSCTPVPLDDRMLATWLSYGDLCRAVGAERARRYRRLPGDLGRVEQRPHDMVAGR